MEVPSNSWGSGGSPNASPSDPRLQPTPDYGTLGPGSDLRPGSPVRPSGRRTAMVLAAIAGALVAILVRSASGGSSERPSFAKLFHRSSDSSSEPKRGDDSSNALKPQQQAEALLERAVSRSDGAVEQIASDVDSWRGKLRWDSQIAALTTAALNSTDLRVRESGIEVELAAYGLGKNTASFDYVLRTLNTGDQANSNWALWSLGLLGNRGVETERAVQVLTAHLHDSAEESRHWSVEGLALVGTNSVIPALLQTMHDDPSPLVRERAACGLAESGMFTQEQRLSAVPQLINYTDDPSLDAPTHAWAFHALRDITQQQIPADTAAWRNWYKTANRD